MKKNEVKLGAPKKKESSVKKNRCIRLSDDDVSLIKKNTKMTLQEFINNHVEKLKNV